jgi:1-pyrroline-5-carboxylate dehydrogenase
MSNGFFRVPPPKNEPILSYAPGTPERLQLQDALTELRDQFTDIPMVIGGEQVRTGRTVPVRPPHDHHHPLGHFHDGDASHAKAAIAAALAARERWDALPWEQRIAIFLKAADLSATKYRYRLNAATMLGQSKNAYQAEIDSACEWIDFLRFNAHFATEIYQNQPISGEGVWNRLEYRPLEGFVFALTPFNFTAIAGNLPACVAMMGNVVVWKPATTQMLAAHVLMQVLTEAGLPAGVINLIQGDGPELGKVIFEHRDFAGIHFTGSTGVFQSIWKQIGENIHRYKSYPRIVGETGGKDFVVAHRSADPKALAVALVRGAFEFQGQKCSAASRAYIPSNLWDETWHHLHRMLGELTMGTTQDFSNFINAVIDERAFDKIAKYIADAANDPSVEIIAGGKVDKSVGYFIEPTVIKTDDPRYVTMCEEIFGPVLTVHVYDENRFEEILDVVDTTSPYALTGSIFAQDRYAVQVATQKLVNAAGNFYINDKPTGAVVGQQPFGGARASGTNDKAGSAFNLLRWVSVRTIKETFNPPVEYRYPFMNEN